MEIIIEPVKLAELEELAHLSVTTFYDTFHEKNTQQDMEAFLQTTFNSKALKREVEDARNRFYFAKADGKTAGYTKLSDAEKPAELQNANALEISRIYVAKEWIGKAVGKAMISFAIKQAKSEQKQTIWLGVWEHNQRAIDFYKRLGFKKFGEHVFMLGSDAQIDWLMKLEL